MMSLEDSTSVQFNLCRHKQGTAVVANIYGRLTGGPTRCLGSSWSGATNLITRVADANLYPSPILALNVLGSSERGYKESRQLIDVVGMLTPVATWVNPMGLTSRNQR